MRCYAAKEPSKASGNIVRSMCYYDCAALQVRRFPCCYRCVLPHDYFNPISHGQLGSSIWHGCFPHCQLRCLWNGNSQLRLGSLFVNSPVSAGVSETEVPQGQLRSLKRLFPESIGVSETDVSPMLAGGTLGLKLLSVNWGL